MSENETKLPAVDPTVERGPLSLEEKMATINACDGPDPSGPNTCKHGKETPIKLITKVEKCPTENTCKATKGNKGRK